MADTEQPELSLERFQALVEAYGGNVERFPAREKRGARELLARSDAAQRLLDAACAFDQVLAEARADAAPSLVLIEKLVSIPERHAQRTPVVRMLPFRSVKQTWLAAAAAVLLGVIGGYADSVESDTLDSTEMASMTFADDLFEDLTVDEGEAR